MKLTLTTTLLLSVYLAVELSESRTIRPSPELSQNEVVVVPDDVQKFMSLRDELGARLRERLAARFDINDPTFNQILEDVLKSIHRYSRPRYGRSVRFDRRSEKRTDEIKVEKTVELLSNSPQAKIAPSNY